LSANANSPLDVQRLQRELRTTRYGRSLDHRLDTGSTNDDARAALAAGAVSGHAVCAEAQTAGRGSRGRQWASPAGTDLYVSIVDRIAVAPAQLPPLTLAVGLAVAESCDALLAGRGAPPSQVKWPNDVLIAGKKCAGVLLESNLGHRDSEGVVIGIGLNVNRASFPVELQPTATSLHLCQPTPQRIDRTQALATLLDHVERRVEEFTEHGAAAIVRVLQLRLAYLGLRVSCDGVPGIVRGLAPTGGLLFETELGTNEIHVGRLERLS
jgi:BirA family biotin operon repressor/biotin-[acetyl-CoA-carboxylase] ligase